MLITESNSESKSHSVLSNSLQPHERYSPWNSPGQNTGVGNCSLLQENIPTQGSNPGLPHCRCILYQLSHKEAQDKKQRGTKEPLDESERGEWKGWLLTQHSENYDHGIWSHQFSSVQSLSTPWITARQASLSITNSRSLLKPMSIELVMPSNHLILCRPLLLLPPIPPSWSHHFMANRWGNNGNSDRLYFLGLQNHCGWWLQPWNLKKHLLLGRKTMTNLNSILKSRDITLPTRAT